MPPVFKFCTLALLGMSLNLNISFYENPSLSYSTAKLLLSKNNFQIFILLTNTNILQYLSCLF